MITLVPASRSHVGPIANRMREADRVECAARGHSPKAALRHSLQSSVIAWTALDDGRPEAMLGLASVNILADQGEPWMLGTDRIYSAGRELLRGAPPLLAAMHRYSRRLHNTVSVDNAQAIRLLWRWGFVVGGEVREIGGVQFVPFWREANV